MAVVAMQPIAQRMQVTRRSSSCCRRVSTQVACDGTVRNMAGFLNFFAVLLELCSSPTANALRSV